MYLRREYVADAHTELLDSFYTALANQDGLIIDHRDHFDFWKWSRQALGAPGLLLGWSPMLKSKVRSSTRGNLDTFQAKS